MPSLTRRAYFKQYYKERVSLLPRAERIPTTCIQVRVTRSKKAAWKQHAGDQALSRFIAEAVDTYIAEIEEGTHDKAS